MRFASRRRFLAWRNSARTRHGVKAERCIDVLCRRDDEHSGVGRSDEHPGVASQRAKDLVLKCLLSVLACEQAEAQDRQNWPWITRRDRVFEKVANEPLLILAEGIIGIRRPALREANDSALCHRGGSALASLRGTRTTLTHDRLHLETDCSSAGPPLLASPLPRRTLRAVASRRGEAAPFQQPSGTLRL